MSPMTCPHCACSEVYVEDEAFHCRVCGKDSERDETGRLVPIHFTMTPDSSVRNHRSGEHRKLCNGCATVFGTGEMRTHLKTNSTCPEALAHQARKQALKK